MTSWPRGIAAITLFVGDVDRAKTFYSEVFALPVHFEDPHSAVFRFGETLVNLLDSGEAPALVEPAEVGAAGAGVRFVLTVPVSDVDAACADLRERGATLLNGPMDRPWGIRTASFQDPDGYVWELAQPLA